jgi:hypothetical protein
MTTQAVSCTIALNDGSIVNMAVAATDGTSIEVKTSGTVGAGGGIAATSIGTYANGKTITHFITPVTATYVQWAYLERRGSILRILPTGSNEQFNESVAIAPIRLEAGDTIQVLTGASAVELRQVNYACITASGTNAIFSAQPSVATSGSVSLTHILSGQGIGSSLTGQQIVSHFATGQEGGRYAGGSMLLVNDRGLPEGSSVVTNTTTQPLRYQTTGLARIDLNWQAQVVLTS